METIYFKEKVLVAYIVEMSNKRSVQVDPDEIGKVYQAITSGNPTRVRQGIINPSFVVDVVLDEKRVKEIDTERYEVERHNKHDRDYSDGKNQHVFKGMRSLKDIFADVPNLPKLAPPKQLDSPQG